jgi:amidase
MTPKAPTTEQLARIACGLHLNLSSGQLDSFRAMITASMSAYGRLDELPEPAVPVRYPRTSGWRPKGAENRLGAWYWKTDISGASGGALAGKTVAIKDNVCVAGVPMMNGSCVLEGYIPPADASVVSRILDAGGRILGKATCGRLCFDLNADTGPILNPYNLTRHAGASSGGSGALVAAGEVDMSIGGDQGGSIRIPASWCGIYGLKPSYGLVPYTGAFPLDPTLDHLGPMAGSVENVALLLEAIAGPDGLDSRQARNRLAGQPYSKVLDGNVKGLRLGLLAQGFGTPGAEHDVDEAVTEAAHAFERLGCVVGPVSVPWHRDGTAVFGAIGNEGISATIMGNGSGAGLDSHQMISMLDAFARGRLARADDLPEQIKFALLIGQYMREVYHGRYYAKAQNLARALRAAYDEALANWDLLVMPTTPMKAIALPRDGNANDMRAAYSVADNTCQFDVTGHPAISVPCAMSAGLPIGMMLVGRIGEDATILKASHAFACLVFSVQSPPKLIEDQDRPDRT